MKKKSLLYILPIVVVAGAIGASATFAKGGPIWEQSPENFSQMFEEKAQVLGINADELKEAWSLGKNILDVAKEKGLTEEQVREKMRTYRLSETKTNLQNLVNNGVLTQTQADARYKWMESNDGQKRGEGKRMGGGFGMDW